MPGLACRPSCATRFCVAAKQGCGSATNLKVPSSVLDFLGNARSCKCAAGYAATTPSCDYATLTGCAIDQCATNCAAQGLAPSTLTSGCVACSASLTLGFSTSLGDCACFAGKSGSLALVETPASSTSPAFKSCVACPNRTLVFAAAVPAYRRPADLASCQGCLDPHASMQADGSCACDAGYLAAGDPAYAPDRGVTCVLQAAAAPVLSSYPVDGAVTVSYFELQARGGRKNGWLPVCCASRPSASLCL